MTHAGFEPPRRPHLGGVGRGVVFAGLLAACVASFAAGAAPASYSFGTCASSAQVAADCERELAARKAQEMRLQQPDQGFAAAFLQNEHIHALLKQLQPAEHAVTRTMA